nr:hypothetical protein [candidate division Zixibacteria bacterium]
MSEKKDIEFYTAEGFLSLYNSRFGTSYEIVKKAEAPDIICRDKKDNQLNLEITLSEDRNGDIPAMLGRSDSRSYNSLANGKIIASHLQNDVCQIMIKRIKAKLDKHYGPNTALVVRHVSGIPWNWDNVIDSIKNSLNLRQNPYDKGIWIMNNSKTEIFRIA